jgi:hypothetical protein
MIFEFWCEVHKEEGNINNDNIIVRYYYCYYHYHLLIELDSQILDLSLLTHSNANLFHCGLPSTSLTSLVTICSPVLWLPYWLITMNFSFQSFPWCS